MKKEIVLNIGDLLVGPAGKIILITNLETSRSSEYRIYGYFNEENKEAFLAYENDIKNMIEKGTWKHYRVVE